MKTLRKNNKIKQPVLMAFVRFIYEIKMQAKVICTNVLKNADRKMGFPSFKFKFGKFFLLSSFFATYFNVKTIIHSVGSFFVFSVFLLTIFYF